MRLLRPWFTLRRLMVAVAIIAVATYTGIVVWRIETYAMRADAHARHLNSGHSFTYDSTDLIRWHELFHPSRAWQTTMEILMDVNLPCKTCPWRVDQHSTVIPRYDHDKACRLLNTVGDGDDFRPIMACHNSTDSDTIACKGYLAREGWSNLNVRLLLMRGQIENPSVVLQTCKVHNIELEPDYPTVLAKLSASSVE